MAKTVVGSFDSFSDAQRVVGELESQGISGDDISIIGNDARGEYAGQGGRMGSGTTGGSMGGATGADATGHTTGEDVGKGAVAGGAIGGTVGLIAALVSLTIPGIGPIVAAGPLAAALTGAGIGAVAGGLAGGLRHVGVPDSHAGYYAEAVRRGGALVTVRADDAQADAIAAMMRRYGAHDIDERVQGWRSRGWTGHDVDAQAYSAQELDAERQAVLPVVQEELVVGKRAVEQGGVRVETRVTETPVNETVSLREEHATIERHPVSRPATEADLAGLKDTVIEVRETAEEAVVAKTARVVEEVVVGKEVTQHQQTVSDTVRRTDVEVERIEDHAMASRGTGTTADRVGGTTTEHAGGTARSGLDRAKDAIERAIPGDSDRDGK